MISTTTEALAEPDNGLKNDIYSTYNFDWTKWNDWDKEWNVHMKYNIKEARLMYSFVTFYINNYMGAPGRPPEEQYFVPWLQKELYKMIQDYNYSHHTTQ